MQSISARKVRAEELAYALNNLAVDDEELHGLVLETIIRVASKRLLRKELDTPEKFFNTIRSKDGGMLIREGKMKLSWERRWQNWGATAALKDDMDEFGYKAIGPMDVYGTKPTDIIPIFDSYFDIVMSRLRDKAVLLRSKSNEVLIMRVVDAEKLTETATPYGERPRSTMQFWDTANNNQAAEKEPSAAKEKGKKMSKVSKFFDDVKVTTSNATKRQAGRTALAVIHTAVFEKLPIKWSWWAKLTGRKQKIINSPYTKLVTAAAAHGLVVALKPDSKVAYITKGALQFALDNAIDKGVDVEQMVQKAMGVDKTLLDELYSKLADEGQAGEASE